MAYRELSSPRAWTWAALTHGAFADVLACPHCGGRLRLIATPHDPAVIRTCPASGAVGTGLRILGWCSTGTPSIRQAGAASIAAQSWASSKRKPGSAADSSASPSTRRVLSLAASHTSTHR